MLIFTNNVKLMKFILRDPKFDHLSIFKYGYNICGINKDVLNLMIKDSKYHDFKNILIKVY